MKRDEIEVSDFRSDWPYALTAAMGVGTDVLNRCDDVIEKLGETGKRAEDATAAFNSAASLLAKAKQDLVNERALMAEERKAFLDRLKHVKQGDSTVKEVFQWLAFAGFFIVLGVMLHAAWAS